MRNIKRLASILLVLIMVFAMATTVMADTTDSTEATETKYTISTSNDHTYQVYQICTGDLAEGALSNLVWCDNGTGTEGDPVSADILEELADIKDDPIEIAQLDMIRKYVDLDSEAHATVTKDAPASVAAGYYLIKDSKEPVTNNDSYTLYIVQVSDNVTIKETHTISTSGTHTYEVYQIFVGDLSGKTLSNVVWGKNGTGTAGKKVDADIMTKLEGTGGTDTEQLAVIKEYVNLGSEPYGTVTGTTALKYVPAGYYLIKDVDGTFENAYDSYTLYIVKIVGDVTIDPKSGVPSVEKKVDDINDSNNSEDKEVWEDSADYDIGDSVPFQITATLPANYADYSKYTMTFIDTMEKGLTYDAAKANLTVMFGETDITRYFTASTAADGDNTVLTITCDDLKEIDGLANSSQIVVTYNAVLNENAALGATGNKNTVKMQFSNDPNWTADPDNNPDTPTPDDHPEEPKGETPEDTVIVFTYQTIINKVDGSKTAPDNALAGAAFKLEKKNADGSWKLVKEYKAGDTTFTFTGLDDGTYKLTETVTPTGYNAIDPIEFTITAKHDIKATDPKLTKLESSNNTFEVNLEAGTLTTEVVNNRGSVLPETGGIGTTIFYILGGVLVVAAVVLLVTKKRMSAQ